MNGPLGVALAGLTMLVGVSSAYAASGRVMFSGGVIEPTCLTTGPDGASLRAGSAPQRMSCGRAAGDAGRAYTREVMDLAAANPHHDRLLDYFASYSQGASGDATARVVVHTYD